MLEMPKKAEPEDIEELIQAHANAAVRAREGGYDGVEIHSAYGGRITRRKNRAPNGHPQTVEKPLVDLGLAAIEHHSLDCHALSQKRPKHVLVKSSPVPRDGGGRRRESVSAMINLNRPARNARNALHATRRGYSDFEYASRSRTPRLPVSRSRRPCRPSSGQKHQGDRGLSTSRP